MLIICVSSKVQGQISSNSFFLGWALHWETNRDISISMETFAIVSALFNQKYVLLSKNEFTFSFQIK